ncbi:hypothetical protein [Hirschia litorea]|uniref:Uncharacterized protein n=1 Tax=Hirschia litorea TaxID=1199156 RepID=A0ABW2IJ79_9PROT
MRTISFLCFIIALTCGGLWGWLSLQGSSPIKSTENAASPPVVMMEAPAPAPAPAPMSAPAPASAPAKENTKSAQSSAEMPQIIPPPNASIHNRFSTQSTDDDPIVAERSIESVTPSALDNFKSRPIAYNRPPEVMALNQAVDVSLIIDATDEANPAAGLEGFEGEVVERDVVLSDEVAAQLTGQAFDIQLMSVSRQILSSRAQNRWQWRVTPIKEGEHMLILEIFGYAKGSNAAEPLDAYRDKISVEVKQFDKIVTLAKDYEPVIGAIGGIAGMFSALFAFIRFAGNRKKKKRRA